MVSSTPGDEHVGQHVVKDELNECEHEGADCVERRDCSTRGFSDTRRVTSSRANSASREAFTRTSSALLCLAVARSRATIHAESCAGRGLDKVIALFATAVLASMLALTSTKSPGGIARSMSCITLISCVALLTSRMDSSMVTSGSLASLAPVYVHSENLQVDQERCWQLAQKFSKMCPTICEYHTNGISASASESMLRKHYTTTNRSAIRRQRCGPQHFSTTCCCHATHNWVSSTTGT